MVFGEDSPFSMVDGLRGNAAILGIENATLQRSSRVGSSIGIVSVDGEDYRSRGLRRRMSIIKVSE